MFHAKLKVWINKSGEVVTRDAHGKEIVLAKAEESYQWLLAHVVHHELPAVKNRFCPVAEMRGQLA